MTTYTRQALKSALLAIVFYMGFASPALAASEGLQIKPAVIEDKANPGDTYRFVLNVSNLSNNQRTFNLTTQDISGLDQNGLPIFAPASEQTQYELSSWVELPSGQVTLAPNETKQISFTVRVPVSASPGSHFGGIFLDENVQRLSQNGSGIGVKIGSVMSLRIAGNATEGARIREFSTDKLVYDSAKVGFTTKVENMGNVLERPHGVIDVTDMFGRKVSSITVNDKAAPVFPNGERVYATQWTYDGLAFGRYEAVVSLVYGDQAQQTISSTASFWILPMKPILITLGTLVGVIVLFYLFIRSYIRSKLRSMGVRTENDVYRKQYGSQSRLMLTVSGFAVLATVFLVILFFMFA